MVRRPDDTAVIDRKPKDVGAVGLLLAFAFVAFFCGTLAGVVGHTLGKRDGIDDARQSACSHWCDSKAHTMEQDHYLYCLRKCPEWRCE